MERIDHLRGGGADDTGAEKAVTAGIRRTIDVMQRVLSQAKKWARREDQLAHVAEVSDP